MNSNYTIVKASIPDEVRERVNRNASKWRDVRDGLTKAQLGDTFRVSLPNRGECNKAQSAIRGRKMLKLAPEKKFVTMSHMLRDGTYDLYIEVISA